MNAVEIEQAVSELSEQPFDAAGFPYAFLLAFGNKEEQKSHSRTLLLVAPKSAKCKKPSRG